MLSLIALLRSGPLPRAVALSAMAIGVAGCSAEVTRFNDSPFASRASADYTGTVPAQSAPVSRVEQSQLPPPPGPGGYQPAPASGGYSGGYQSAPASGGYSGGYSGGGVSGGGRGMASYAPATYTPASYTPASYTPDVTGTAETPHAVAPRPVGNSARPIAATPMSGGSMSGSAIHGPATPANPGVHVVVPGDTLYKLSRLYKRPVAEIAKANNIEPHATLRVGQRMVIPGAHVAAAKLRETPKDPAREATKPPAKQAQAKPLASLPAAKPVPVAKQRTASLEPVQSASVVSPAVEAAEPAHAPKQAAADATPSFRWPVKGRIIAHFGPRTNGQQNDGINLAVPEGTPVKAAEDGVVAYAGNELKGYGNLVLVRHSNGYVTAYAHANELLAKRGDTIKRGQVIAKSGQTGNVDAPQLHFEVRKGPSPLDPLPLLGGG